MEKPISAKASRPGSGVFPPKTMLATCGTLIDLVIWASSSRFSGASTKVTSAPASTKLWARSIASERPLTALASVRAMIWRSPSRRVSTAALIFCTISSVEIMALPAKWPQRLGEDLILELYAGGARALEQTHSTNRVEWIAETRIAVHDEGHRDHISNGRDCLRYFGDGGKTDVWDAQTHICDAGPGYVDDLVPEILDHAREQRVRCAGHRDGFALADE